MKPEVERPSWAILCLYVTLGVHYGQWLRRDVAVGVWHCNVVSSVSTPSCAHDRVPLVTLRCAAPGSIVPAPLDSHYLWDQNEAEETFPPEPHQPVCKLVLSLHRTGVRPRQRQSRRVPHDPNSHVACSVTKMTGSKNCNSHRNGDVRYRGFLKTPGSQRTAASHMLLRVSLCCPFSTLLTSWNP